MSTTKIDAMLDQLSKSAFDNSQVDNTLFEKFNVKRGLRNEDHSGVLVGLTNVGDVVGYDRQEDGTLKAIPGKLMYRGIDVQDLVRGVQADNRLGFEEVAYLLLSGSLPNKEELATFGEMLNHHMPLEQKIKMSILELEGNNVMNILARSVLEMYIFDENPDDLSKENLMRQTINLIAKFPTVITYAFNSMRHHTLGLSLNIRHPQEGMSHAENFLYMLRGKGEYTDLDVKTLDLALILHAEHGGGNNSTFTVRVTSSTNTDTYSSIAAGIGSLKGPLHGGASLQMMDMFTHLKDNIKDWSSDAEIEAYLVKMLNKEAYNRTGLIYGIGHAVYTISDPRAVLLKEMARELAKEKGRMDEFNFLEKIEEKGIETFMEFKGGKAGKQVCANVDFYSGFVYDMLALPPEIYIPLFAMSRIVGWCAHRIEELSFSSKRIIRPAYKNVATVRPFLPLNQR